MTTTKLSYAGRAVAFGLPMNDAIERMLQSARELNESGEKIATEHEQYRKSGFGQRIAVAVQSKVQPRTAVVASGAVAPIAEAEGFGHRIGQAVASRLRP